MPAVEVALTNDIYGKVDQTIYNHGIGNSHGGDAIDDDVVVALTESSISAGFGGCGPANIKSRFESMLLGAIMSLSDEILFVK